MADRVFFYGTLRTGFNRTTRAGIDALITFVGGGWIDGKLFDLGIYPAAVPATDAKIRGEVFDLIDAPTVLAALDRIEGFRPSEPERSLYNRVRVAATLDDGSVEDVWVYFYNAPLGRAPRIMSGDYIEHLKSSRART